MGFEILGLSPQQFAGVALIGGAGLYTAWQWWQSRPAKQSKPLATEAEFQMLITGIRDAYAAAMADNRRLNAELAAIRKVVGDPLPVEESKPAARAKK